MEKNQIWKYPNFKFKLDGNIDWHIAYANIMCSFSMDKRFNFLMNFPKPIVKDWKIAL
jgi:hypothetical protein